MHFSKTYAQLLLTLPPELRDNAIQYRQLKKVINQIVIELSALGLKPAILHELIEASDSAPSPDPSSSEQEAAVDTNDAESSSSHTTQEHTTHTTSSSSSTPLKLSQPRVVYELNSTSGKIEPQLRIWISVPPGGVSVPKSDVEGDDGSIEDAESLEEDGHTTLLWRFQQQHFKGFGLGGGSITEVNDSAESLRDELDALSINHDSDPSSNLVHELESHPESSSHPESGSPPHLQPDIASQPHPHSEMHEIIIPLIHDTEFYSLLSTTLESISAHLAKMHADFLMTLEDLSRTISDSAHPASVAASFQPLSRVENEAGAVRVRTGELKSDLYFWREIFQLYLEAEVFESVGEATRGEHSVEESERRLQLFAERATKHSLSGGSGSRGGRKGKQKQSLEALEGFLRVNLFILNVKKFSHANSEATRKILKKHAKRTALFFPGLQSSITSPPTLTDGTASNLLALVPQSSSSLNFTLFSFPRILVQAIGTTLLPIIPSLEDYSCLICTSIAFKPIRLSCGHLFCVRCLVKMQKRKQGDCPMCRARVVLGANRSNVDWALLNFMQDWFPLEAKEKLKSNEKEATEEELRELGIDPDQSACVVM